MKKTEDKKKTLTNFRKAQSHIKRIVTMLEDGHYCVDVMQQNLAVIGLLKSAHQMLMAAHLDSCFKKAIESKNRRMKKKMANEILRVTNLFNR